MDSYKCFCGNEFRYEQMKNHYKECTNFKNQFREIDINISKSIKHFVDKISNSKDDDYMNGLFWLKFLIKRYVNLVGDLIKKGMPTYKINDKNNEKFNQIHNDFIKIKPSDVNIKANNSINQKQLGVPRNNSSLDLGRQLTQANLNTIKESPDEEELIRNYCNKVRDNTNAFDDNMIKIMSDSISALTSRDCFVMVKNKDEKLIIHNEDEDKMFYTFLVKDTNFYVLLY